MKGCVIVFMALSVVLTGCGKKAGEAMAEKMIESAMEKEGSKGKVNISDGKVTVETKDGKSEFTSGADAKIPDNFPKDVLVYPGAKVTTVVYVPDGSAVMLQTKDAPDKVVETYKSKMTGAGWKEEMSMNQGGNVILVYKKDTRSASIVVAGANKVTQINLTISGDKSTAKAEKAAE